MDSWLLVIVVFCVVLALLAAIARSTKPSFSGLWPFQVKRPLTSPEQVLYWRLVKALPDNMVLAQVQLDGAIKYAAINLVSTVMFLIADGGEVPWARPHGFGLSDPAGSGESR